MARLTYRGGLLGLPSRRGFWCIPLSNSWLRMGGESGLSASPNASKESLLTDGGDSKLQ